jgi:hypothetical protein
LIKPARFSASGAARMKLAGLTAKHFYTMYATIIFITNDNQQLRGTMTRHSHQFVEDYSGFVGFGFNRETDEDTLMYYLQKFSDDTFMKTIIKRLSDDELSHLFDIMTKLMKTHLSEPEYHKLFLKE